MGKTATRIALGVGTMGLTEGFGFRPILEHAGKALMPNLQPPTVPAAPSTETKEVQRASAETSRRRSFARGLRSTLLTTLAQQSGLKTTIGG